MAEGVLDPAFAPLFRHILGLADLPAEGPADPRAGFRIEVEQIVAEMPVELNLVVDERGGVQLGSTPPIYYADTSILPVYHALRVTIAADRQV